MPCYLFTYHAFGTWLPDRKKGYVKRKQGILPTNFAEAERYRAEMKEPVAEFDGSIQCCTCAASSKAQFRADSERIAVSERGCLKELVVNA